MSDTLIVMGRPKKTEPTEPLRIPQSVVHRIRRIAAHMKMDPGDYVAQQFAAQLNRDEKKMLEDISRERGDDQSAAKKGV